MKYGLVSPEEWEQNDAWPPNGSFCIAFLENTGALALNRLVTDPPSGDGSVYVIEDGKPIRVGYFTLPTDIHVFGSFDTEQAAVAYYMNEYINVTIATEGKVNEEIQLSIYIDDYVDDSKQRKKSERYWGVIIAALFGIILVLLLYYLRVRLGYPSIFDR